YSDAFTAMVRGLGGTAAPAAGGAGGLRHRRAQGRAAGAGGGGGVLEHRQGPPHQHPVLLLPPPPPPGRPRPAPVPRLDENVTPAAETDVAPLPFVRRLKSGTAVAYDGDVYAKTRAGGQRAYGGLYVVARGKRFVPMLFFYFGGGGSKLEAGVAALLDSA